MRNVKGLLAGALVTTLLATCGGGRTIVGTITLRSPGSLTALPGAKISVDGSTCAGNDAWSYIRAGQAVTIRDHQDKTIATGAVEVGHGTQMECTLTFRISGVPDRDEYKVIFDNGGRLGCDLCGIYSATALEAQNWTIDLVCDDGDFTKYC